VGAGTETMTPGASKMTGSGQAESVYRAAQVRCNAQTGTARTTCISDARAAYDRAPSGNQPNNHANTRAGGAGTAGGTSGGNCGASAAGTGGASGGATGEIGILMLRQTIRGT